MASTHKDVEFAVDDSSKQQPVNLDVLIYSEAGANWWGGSDEVESYLEDPDASVTARIEVSADFLGRIA